MKKIMIIFAVLAILGLTACDNAAKLAGEVEGAWTAPKTDMAFVKKDHKEKPHKDDKDSKEGKGARPEMKPTMACAPTITFTRTQGSNGGDISIFGNYEVTQGVSVTDTVMPAPVKATVSGMVTASGTWQVKDDDEIIVTLDPSKTVVKVDPASLKLDYAMLTDAPASRLESLKQNVANNVVSTVTPMLQQRISQIRKFDDVKITGNTMKLEIGKTKFNFTKK